MSNNRRTFNQLAIAWNVTPIYVEAQENIDKTVEMGIEKLKQKEILEKGDLIVISGGAKLLENAEYSKVVGGVARI